MKNRKNRVLQLGKYYPPVLGGIESCSYCLSEALIHEGYSVEVLCSHNKCSLVIESWRGARIIRLPQIATIASLPINIGGLLWLMLNIHRFDVVHVHYPSPLFCLIIALLPCKIPIILHWHSDVISQKHLYRLVQPFDKILLKKARFVIATSKSYQKASPFLKRVSEKVKTIFCIALLSSNGATDNNTHTHFLGITIGRLVPYKSIETIIHAAQYWDQGIEMWIIGDGVERKKLERLSKKLLVEEKVQFKGMLSDAGVRECFSIADCFVLVSNSRAEAFGIAAVEALSFGKPLITTQLTGSGLDEINVHGVTGIKIPVGDYRSLAASLNRLKNNADEREKMGHAAAMRFKEQYTKEKFVEKVKELYREVINDKGM